MTDADSALMAAFPSQLAEDARAGLAVMPESRLPPASPFSVDVWGGVVAVPYRIYNDEPPASAEISLTPRQRVVLHCLYSRHSDGLIRQRHVEQILSTCVPWVAPFVVRLVGEYVLEILKVIRSGLPDLATSRSPHRFLYGDFIARNPSFFAQNERRVVSYWSCYYRRQHPVFAAYPGCSLLVSLRASASERTGSPWPRHTPPGRTGSDRLP